MTSEDLEDRGRDWDAFLESALSLTPGEAFHAAWSAADPETAAGRLSRRALEAQADSAEELRLLLNELTGRQDRIELVLEGGDIRNHAASAEHLGMLFRSWAHAVKEISKAANQRTRMSSDLLASALSPGSLRVVFEIKPTPPPASAVTTHGTDALQNTGLRTLVSLLQQAEDVDSNTLDASVHALRRPAREAVRSVAKVFTDTGWQVAGTLRRRDGQTTPVEVTSRAAHRILDATRQQVMELEEVTHSGFVDAWSWSKQTMRLELQSGGGIDAYVPDEHAADVARFTAEHTVPVVAKFQVLLTIPTGDASATRRSYTLESIRQDYVQAALGDRD